MPKSSGELDLESYILGLATRWIVKVPTKAEPNMQQIFWLRRLRSIRD